MHNNILYIILSLFLFSGNIKTIASNRADSILRIFQDHGKSSEVLVVAHRGDWRNAPENSILAIENCIKLGVDIVELDVRLTKDSVLVVIHDEKIDRTMTGKGYVRDYTFSELKNMYLKDGLGSKTPHTIPSLEEALHVAQGKILVNIDKAEYYLDKVIAIAHKTQMIKYVIFKGGKSYHDVIGKYGNMLKEINYMPVLVEKTENPKGFFSDFQKSINPFAYEVNFKTTSSPIFKLIPKMKKSHARVWVNTLWPQMNAGHDDEKSFSDPENNWGWVIRHGGNIIQTDRPEALLKYLKSKNLHD